MAHEEIDKLQFSTRSVRLRVGRCIYPADCTDFSNNGLGVVTPTSCTVTETLNGEWELTLEHEIDEGGKCLRLAEAAFSVRLYLPP